RTSRVLRSGGPPRVAFDLAGVGAAEQYASELASRLGGSLTTHGRFGTATVHYGQDAHVDVATARTETYSAPAALPDVAPAKTIEDDLDRRDFTINAMAVALHDGDVVYPLRGRDHRRDQLISLSH